MFRQCFLEILADQKLIFEVLVSRKITLSVQILVRAADQNAIFRNMVSQTICKKAATSLKQGFSRVKTVTLSKIWLTKTQFSRL